MAESVQQVLADSYEATKQARKAMASPDDEGRKEALTKAVEGAGNVLKTIAESPEAPGTEKHSDPNDHSHDHDRRVNGKKTGSK